MKFYKQVKVRTNKTWNFVKKRIPVDKKLKKGEKEYEKSLPNKEVGE